MKETFCAHSIIRPMVYHIEKYSSENLFEENDMKFLTIAVERFQEASNVFLHR